LSKEVWEPRKICKDDFGILHLAIPLTDSESRMLMELLVLEVCLVCELGSVQDLTRALCRICHNRRPGSPDFRALGLNRTSQDSCDWSGLLLSGLVPSLLPTARWQTFRAAARSGVWPRNWMLGAAGLGLGKGGDGG
jgi:hypothetical protein